MKKLYTYAIIAMGTILFACNETKGSWGELIITSPAKNNVDRFATGSTFSVEAKGLGEDLISQYKVQLQLTSNSLSIDTSTVGIPFTKTFLYISSPNQSFPNIDYALTIPSDLLPGQYNLLVSGIVNKNSEAKDTTSIIIYNEIDTIAPSIALIYPENNTTIGKNDTLQLGFFTADRMAYDKDGSLYEVSVDLINQVSLIKTNLYKKTKLKQMELEVEQFVKLPSAIAGGSYILQVTSIDRYNNKAVQSVLIKIE